MDNLTSWMFWHEKQFLILFWSKNFSFQKKNLKIITELIPAILMDHVKLLIKKNKNANQLKHSRLSFKVDIQYSITLISFVGKLLGQHSDNYISNLIHFFPDKTMILPLIIYHDYDRFNWKPFYTLFINSIFNYPSQNAVNLSLEFIYF